MRQNGSLSQPVISEHRKVEQLCMDTHPLRCKIRTWVQRGGVLTRKNAENVAAFHHFNFNTNPTVQLKIFLWKEVMLPKCPVI